MTRRDWLELARALRKVREREGMHAPSVDAATDAIASVLADRSTRFDAERFGREAGRSAWSDNVRGWWRSWLGLWTSLGDFHVKLAAERARRAS